MSDTSLTITFSSDKGSSQENYWLKLEQVGLEPETPSFAETAALVDDLYNIEPCNGTTGGNQVEIDNNGQPIPPTPANEFPAVVQQNLSFNACLYQPDNSYEVQLKVYRSHINEPYKLNVIGGEILQTVRGSEQILENIIVDNAAAVDLQYPAMSSPVFTWQGLIYDGNGSTPDIDIELFGSTVNFGKSITGQLKAEYQSLYDLVTIKVMPVDDATGECSVIGFYHNLATEMQLEQPVVADDMDTISTGMICGATINEPTPDTVECYRTIEHIVKCNCSGDVKKIYETEEIVDCPDGVACPNAETWCRHNMGTVSVVEYDDCGETTQDINDPVFYEQTCCHPPESGFPLPRCATRTVAYTGGRGIVGGPEQYRQLYGDRVMLIAVAPEHGICGKTTTEQVQNQRACCDEVSSIVVSTADSAEVIPPESGGLIVWSGGRPPYTVKVNTPGFYFLDPIATHEQIVTMGTMVFVKLTGDACGSCTIEITDGCSVRHATIRSTTGRWGDFIPITNEGECKILGPPDSGSVNVNGLVFSGVSGRWEQELYDYPYGYASSTTGSCLPSGYAPLCTDQDEYMEASLIPFCRDKNSAEDVSYNAFCFTGGVGGLQIIRAQFEDPNSCCNPVHPSPVKSVRCWQARIIRYREWIC